MSRLGQIRWNTPCEYIFFTKGFVEVYTALQQQHPRNILPYYLSIIWGTSFGVIPDGILVELR